MPANNAMPEHIKKKLEEEIRQLEHELAHELPAEIKKAVALGDLSENAEYHMAKQRQQFRQRAPRPAQKAHGGTVPGQPRQHSPRPRRLRRHASPSWTSNKDEEIEYRLVTSEESDVTKGLISTTSPIGRGLHRQTGRRHGQSSHAQRQPRARNPQTHHHPRS